MDARDLAELVSNARGNWLHDNGNRTMTVNLYEWEEGDDLALDNLLNERGCVTIPAIYTVCDLCEGTGKHVNANIDRGGLTRDDFDDDPDFAENYFSGVYDVRCVQCDGRNVVAIPDPNGNPVILAAIERRVLEEVQMQREDYAERRALGLMSGDSLSDW